MNTLHTSPGNIRTEHLIRPDHRRMTGPEEAGCCDGDAPYFDAISTDYFQRYHEDSPAGYALRVRRQRVLELLGQGDGKVLDVGCGPGVMVQDLMNLGYEFWGVDASSGMIEECRANFGRLKRAHFCVADAARLDFPEGFFDAVICTGVIGDARAGEPAVKEMIRVLKPGGTLLISFPNLLSPYGAWKAFVFYPAMALLRPLYYRLRRRPVPSTLYDRSWLQQFRSRQRWGKRSDSARSAAGRVAQQGVEVAAVVYFYFNVFLSPLDELFTRPTLVMIKALEGLRFGKLRWLGVGFIIKGIKSAR